jgi:hypothetical protein
MSKSSMWLGASVWPPLLYDKQLGDVCHLEPHIICQRAPCGSRACLITPVIWQGTWWCVSLITDMILNVGDYVSCEVVGMGRTGDKKCTPYLERPLARYTLWMPTRRENNIKIRLRENMHIKCLLYYWIVQSVHLMLRELQSIQTVSGAHQPAVWRADLSHYRPLGFQESEGPRFPDSWHMNVVRL